MTSFNLLAVRSYEDDADSLRNLDARGLFFEKAHDDGALYPLLGGEGAPAGMRREPGDGKSFVIEANGLILKKVTNKARTDLLRLPASRTDVLVTESRIAFSCEKWNMSRRAVGAGAGALLAAGTNIVNRSIESRLRRGTLLVGQIRYNWLRRADYGRALPIEPRRLVLLCFDGYDRTRGLALGLNLPRGTDGRDLLQNIASRAGRYVLRSGMEMTDEERRQLTTLVERPVPVDPDGKGKWITIKMPKWEKAHADTVHRPEPRG